ncbi:MAG TPA: type VI secretion system protein TssA [Polyangia bacterium]|jgi:type VI secretion system protein ImpA|nr:type VI secretion system protein TssA [Polyangia bacterium]
MASVDISGFSQPIAGEDPCGPNLEYDAQFVALERAAVGKPEQQIGNTIVKAEDPEWPLVEREARALLARTKDLRVALQLTRALIRVDGWQGFAAALGVLRAMLEQHWDGVHPRLDPDDGKDPTARLNVLAGLGDAPTIAGVRAMPIVASRHAGRFGLREIEIATGETPPTPEEAATAPSVTALEAAMAEAPLETLEATAAAIAASLSALSALEAAVSEKTGQRLALGRLPVAMRKAEGFITTRLAQRRPIDVVDAGANGAGTPAPRVSGEISSREDVIRTLDRVIAYYARHEPSSPIPMLIERSKKLVAMSFFDIIRELAPDGVNQIENLRGRTD